jgi:glucokinase
MIGPFCLEILEFDIYYVRCKVYVKGKAHPSGHYSTRFQDYTNLHSRIAPARDLPLPFEKALAVEHERRAKMRIGIDIGGTKILVGLVNEAGRVTTRKKVKTESDRGYPAVRDKVNRVVRDLLSEARAKPKSIKRIGIACAGQIDQKTERIIFSPNLHWTDVPLKHDVETVTGIKTFIENDVNAATYGEWRFGFHGAGSNVVGIFIGTGIGGGLILNGTLFRGSNDVGGELGHTTLNPYGYPCRCGNTGCFEAYCGGSYLVDRVRQHLDQGYRGKLWDIIKGQVEGLNAGHIEEASMLGDELCRRAWGEVIEYLGAALQSVVNLLNPDLIIFGGGVVAGTKRLIDEARLVMERRAMPASVAGLRIERARLGEEAMILGAAFVMDV